MSDEETSNYERYTEKDLYRDLETLRRAGLIEIDGILDDGQWLYTMTEEGRSLLTKTNDLNYDVLSNVFENIEKVNQEGEKFT
jgi:DNA-binding PadR family transcriptional regulator